MVAERNTRTAATQDCMLIMGRLAAPYGVKGWLRVVSYTEPAGNLLDYTPWYLQRNHNWEAVDVLESRLHGKGLIARLQGCQDRDAAAALTGSEIGVYRQQLPETGRDEYYWSDLVGLRVITRDGRALGRVDHLLETGANDVLVVKGDRERLIPFVQGQVIEAVDLQGGEIRVDWDPDF